MIITEKVEINITSRYMNYYKNLGYDVKVGDKIFIKVSDLMKNSHQYVDVVCDECGVSGRTQYRRIKDKYLCNKCSTKQSMQIKYGVDNAFELDEVKDKIKQTNNKKYGVDYPLQNAVIKEKVKKTNNDKYGVDNPFQNDKIKEKSKLTCLKKYDKEYANQNDKIKEKSKLTCLKKYGFNSPMKDEKIKKKSLDNRKDYLIKFIFNSFIKENIISIDYDNKIYTLKCDNGKDHNYEISNKLLLNRKYNSKTTLCTICNPINSRISDRENKLLDFIKENYSGEIIENSRNIITPYELDIYLPDLNLAFEFNGLYWHNDLYKDKNYHLDKTERCLEKGIQLIHIWEDDWDFKQEIVKSFILSKLNKIKNEILSDDCIVREINNETVINFLINNDIQILEESLINLGLFHQDDLVSVMTFNKNKLNRFCNKIYTNVINSSNKLFNYFIENYKYDEIITLVDRCYSDGELYEKLGFKCINKIEPNYFYVANKKRYIINIGQKIYNSGYLKYSYK